MGRLAGFRAADVMRKLRAAGFKFDRQAKGSHEIWRHPVTGFREVPVHPRDLPEGVVRAIVAQAHLTPDEFLGL